MPISSRQLVKDWIQYLKNNQIISMKSDYASGKLSYKRNPTSSDLLKFLSSTDIDQTEARKAVKSVAGKGTPSGDSNVPSTWFQNEVTPGEEDPAKPAPIGQSLPAPDKPKKYSNDDAEDVDFKPAGSSQQKDKSASDKPLALGGPKPAERSAEGPQPDDTPPRKPRFKYRNKPVTEAFYDNPGDELSEDQIREVFKILAAAANAPKGKPAATAEPEKSPEEKEAETSENLNKLRNLIRNTMSPEQRKGLWAALNEADAITEAVVTRPEVMDIFHNISSLSKNSIDVSDLQRAWKDKKYPNDTADIYAILSRHGFRDKEIDRVFSEVLGDGGDGNEEDMPEISPASRKIAEFVKKNGLVDDVKEFLKSEFGEELGLSKKPSMFDKIKRHFGKKTVAEDVRAIFTAIVKEERANRTLLLRAHENTHLGRMKK